MQRCRDDGGPALTSSTSSSIYDVCIIGGGVVGTAVARALAMNGLQVTLLERHHDVGAGTSKANTAVLHTGFDATPDTVEARLVARGWHLMRRYCAERGISIEETGAVLVAWDDSQVAALPALREKAELNGYAAAELLDRAEVRGLEPHLGSGALAGMLIPDEHIVDPWTPPIAFALDAVAHGAVLHLGFDVRTVEMTADVTTVRGADGRSVTSRFVVNAAGLSGDEIHRRFGFDGFTIRPRRGELIVFDKLARPLLSRVILPVPTATTKGVLVAPTVFGNVLLGPTADEIDDRHATGSTQVGLDDLLTKGRRLLPELCDHEVTAVYAGLRAATEHSDYQLSAERDARYVCLGGIRSTGLTSALALAEEAVDLLRSIGLDLPDAPAAVGTDADGPASRTPWPVARLGEAGRRPYMDGGRIVCHCERVTDAEIDNACAGPLPARDLDGLRRRTRATAGRCQAFWCSGEIAALTGWDPAS